MFCKFVTMLLLTLGTAIYLVAEALPGVELPRLQWPATGAIYEVNLDYFPNHSFAELSERVPKLAELGVTVIYLLPIQENLGSQYLIRDHYKIDPRYGSPDDLKKLVQTAHQYKIRILFDLVTSITNDGSYIVTQHPDWILKDDAGVKQRYYLFPEWGWSLDCANPEVIKYFTGVMDYYYQQFGNDGWRIDSPINNFDPKRVSGDHTRLPLLRALKAELKQKNPDTLFLCEVDSPTILWGDDDDSDAVPLFDEVCEASYSYEFSGFMGGNKTEGFHYAMMQGSPSNGKIRLTELDKIVHGEAASKDVIQYVTQAPVLYERRRALFIENHDTERASWAFPEKHRPLFTLAATLPGVPVIHAGQEIGSTQPSGHAGERTAPSAVVDWATGDTNMEEFYRKILRVRRENPALTYGNLVDVWKGGDRTIAYLRSYDNNDVLVVISFQDKPTRTEVALPEGDLKAVAGRGHRMRDLLDQKTSLQKGSDWVVELPANGFRVMRLEPGAAALR